MLNIITFKERNSKIRSSIKYNIQSPILILKMLVYEVSDCPEKYSRRNCTGALRVSYYRLNSFISEIGLRGWGNESAMCSYVYNIYNSIFIIKVSDKFLQKHDNYTAHVGYCKDIYINNFPKDNI